VIRDVLAVKNKKTLLVSIARNSTQSSRGFEFVDHSARRTTGYISVRRDRL